MLGVVQHSSDLTDMKQFNLLSLHHFVLTTVVLVEGDECPFRRELMQHSPRSIQLLIRLWERIHLSYYESKLVGTLYTWL